MNGMNGLFERIPSLTCLVSFSHKLTTKKNRVKHKLLKMAGKLNLNYIKTEVLIALKLTNPVASKISTEKCLLSHKNFVTLKYEKIKIKQLSSQNIYLLVRR